MDDHGRMKLQVAWTPAGLERHAPERVDELNLAATPKHPHVPLCRGIYFVGLSDDRGDHDDLMAYQFGSPADSHTGRAQLYRSTWLSAKPVLPPIPYLVFSVEYGHPISATNSGKEANG